MAAGKMPAEEYRQQKINEGRFKLNEAVGSFKEALNSVLDEAATPVFHKVEENYRTAVSVADFAKADITTQKIIAELVEALDRSLKKLVS